MGKRPLVVCRLALSMMGVEDLLADKAGLGKGLQFDKFIH